MCRLWNSVSGCLNVTFLHFRGGVIFGVNLYAKIAVYAVGDQNILKLQKCEIQIHWPIVYYYSCRPSAKLYVRRALDIGTRTKWYWAVNTNGKYNVKSLIFLQSHNQIKILIKFFKVS